MAEENTKNTKAALEKLIGRIVEAKLRSVLSEFFPERSEAVGPSQLEEIANAVSILQETLGGLMGGGGGSGRPQVGTGAAGRIRNSQMRGRPADRIREKYGRGRDEIGRRLTEDIYNNNPIQGNDYDYEDELPMTDGAVPYDPNGDYQQPKRGYVQEEYQPQYNGGGRRDPGLERMRRMAGSADARMAVDILAETYVDPRETQTLMQEYRQSGYGGGGSANYGQQESNIPRIDINQYQQAVVQENQARVNTPISLNDLVETGMIIPK